ncbi:MAG: HIT domain-containing protein [Bryobacter sp.]|nr:HIT domain-containing protein [Bryobacter sp.]
MDRLFSPWRYQYVTGGEKPSQPSRCIFCPPLEGHYLVFTGLHCYGLLNRFPYSSGHLMIAPLAHVSRLSDLPNRAYTEMMLYARLAEQHLFQLYRCHGLNIGFNIGASAGAGIAGHLHLHLVPRWEGDANFMTTIGETRLLPEDLAETHRKLRSVSWEL